VASWAQRLIRNGNHWSSGWKHGKMPLEKDDILEFLKIKYDSVPKFSLKPILGEKAKCPSHFYWKRSIAGRLSLCVTPQGHPQHSPSANHFAATAGHFGLAGP
jgi:hypothetical protein